MHILIFGFHMKLVSHIRRVQQMLCMSKNNNIKILTKHNINFRIKFQTRGSSRCFKYLSFEHVFE